MSPIRELLLCQVLVAIAGGHSQGESSSSDDDRDRFRHILPAEGTARDTGVLGGALGNLLYANNPVTAIDHCRRVACDRGVEDFYQRERPMVTNAAFARFDGRRLEPTRNGTFRSLLSQRRHVVLLVFDSSTTLDEFTKQTAPLSFTASVGGTFFVVVFASDGPACDEAEAFGEGVLRRIWDSHEVLDVVLYVSQCEVVVRRDPLANATTVISGEELKRDDVRQSLVQRHTNMRGYPLRATVFRRMPTMIALDETPASLLDTHLRRDALGYTGVDGFALACLARSLNFSAVVVSPLDGVEYGYTTANGTITGTAGDVFYRRADIGFNGRYMRLYGDEDFFSTPVVFTEPLLRDELCVIAPKAPRVPAWSKMFLVFDRAAWGAIAVTTCLAAGAWALVRRARPDENADGRFPRQTSSWYDDFIELCLMIASQPCALPRTVTRERILLAGCLVFSAIFSGTFQGYLNTAFSTVSYYPDINTLQQLDKSGLYVASSSSTDGIFGTGVSKLLDSLQEKTKLTKTAAIKLAAYEGNVCAMERRSDARTTLELYYTAPDGEPLLHVVDECPRSYYLAYVARRHYPFLPRVNAFLARCVEAGLARWWYDAAVDSILVHYRYNHAAASAAWKRLRMVDVQTAFYALAVGTCAAAVVFCLEVCRWHLIKM